MKIIKLEEDDESMLNDVSGEINILRDCNHPNIVRYYGSYLKGESLWVRGRFVMLLLLRGINVCSCSGK